MELIAGAWGGGLGWKGPMTDKLRRSRLVGERAPAPAALLEGGGGDGGGLGEPHRRHRIRTLRSAFRLPGPPVLEGRGARHQQPGPL